MNNRKLIFLIIGAVLLIIILLFLLLAKGGSKNTNTGAKKSGTFTIWTVGDSETKFVEFLTSFKEANKSMSNIEYSIYSFPNFEEYNNALTSAMIKGVAPDIFVLNNNEESIFEEKIEPIPNSEISTHKFRKEYKGIFIDDLISTKGEGDEKQEFIKGVPVGYETLGILFNKGYPFRLNPSDFTSYSTLGSTIKKKKEANYITLAVGNGSTVTNSPDILAQLFLLNKVKSLDSINGSKTNSTLVQYNGFGDINGDNGYNELYGNAISSGKNDLDLFVDRKVGAIITYPRTIEKLQSDGFPSNFLFAAPFPHSFSGDGNSLANYNYFVLNKDSLKKDVGLAMLKYLNSDEGSTEYLAKYKYYLPAKVILESKLGEQKISNYFKNIELRDFYSEEPLSSFNKGNKVLFDKNIIQVLDNSNSYLSSFERFKSSTLCKNNKMLKLENLSTSCE